MLWGYQDKSVPVLFIWYLWSGLIPPMQSHQFDFAFPEHVSVLTSDSRLLVNVKERGGISYSISIPLDEFNGTAFKTSDETAKEVQAA